MSDQNAFRTVLSNLQALPSPGRPPFVFNEPSGCIWNAVIGRFPVVKKLLISGPGLPQPISTGLLSTRVRANEQQSRPIIYRVCSDDGSRFIRVKLEVLTENV